jgi:hypothetical protein
MVCGVLIILLRFSELRKLHQGVFKGVVMSDGSEVGAGSAMTPPTITGWQFESAA